MQSYLVHFRDRQLALAVGAGLEDRLTRDGHDAVALVPASDGLALTRVDGTGRRASRRSYGEAPQVVALYEEGLLAKLESLGLTAYVGVRPDEEPGIIRWGNGGAMLLPVTTARELIDAVADHTPWAAHAAKVAKRAVATPTVQPRKLAVAGIVGPMLVAGLPVTAAAATAPHHSPAKTGGTPVATTAFAAKFAPQTAQSPVPADTQQFLDRIDSAIQFFLRQTRQAAAHNTRATQALENQIMRLVNAFINSQRGASSPTAPPQGGSPGSQRSGSPAGQGGGAQQSPGQGGGSQGGGQGQGGQGQQNPDQQGSGSQSPSASQGSMSGQGSMSEQGSMSGQGSMSRQGSMSSGAGTSSSGPGASSAGGTSSSGSGGSFGGGASSGGGSS